MRYLFSALALAASLPLLGGCGQMGPLYMPPQETTQSQPTPQADSKPQQQTDES